jgi:YD repeat-containing protein
LFSRGSILFAVVLFAFGCDSASQRQLGDKSIPTIVKQPVAVATHTFDPASPPAEMPPLSAGENAECDSNFLSNASVRGETRRNDATHATLTVTGVKVTLQLNINIWVPAGASQHLIEHEQGHRQISEYYYDTADKLAERIAAAYLGRRIDISGADLNVESGKMLQQLATEINDEYNKELNPQPTQLLYDTITDHGRNEVIVKDAVEHALKNVVVESAGANNANR